ncbi:MAG: DUF4037 domain-containing protein [Candidatus Obscuribacter sp.]|jgi:hypothetical protein|nr:DUF4037 domain-containing protein [Candidatus Obscuribacter sp.]MBP7576094.1 DUF4037 domain-containing protein [Candidatus Obscuribacter sp.]MDQ5965547.1 hypothetical protein [Cyanobacteriota bacterium erpe_2018_sw_39hr_WHONDRS-SW48-000098_B_bin.30]
MQKSKNNPAFISGLDLAKGYYSEIVGPLLTKHYPDLKYAAALIGEGSDVLGFDTEISCDHDWGPRLLLFVDQKDLHYKDSILANLKNSLPKTYMGFATGFIKDNGVHLMDHGQSGDTVPRITIQSIDDYISDYLSIDIHGPITTIDWLTMPEQKLLALTGGRVFYDAIGIEALRKKLSYYPNDVWLYLMASAWSAIEQEEHLMGRAGIVGDELGSALIASRLVQNIMRLCFLMARQYAPYAKWFGSAFNQLKAKDSLSTHLQGALAASNWQGRQQYLSQAYTKLVCLHNQLQITEPQAESVLQFHERPFEVISMGRMSQSLIKAIKDPEIKALSRLPLIGSIDQLSSSTDLLSKSLWRSALTELYKTGGVGND